MLLGTVAVSFVVQLALIYVPFLQSIFQTAALDLGDRMLHVHGELIWVVTRGPSWVLAMRFDDLPERDGDLIRMRVFQALREERAAAAR